MPLVYLKNNGYKVEELDIDQISLEIRNNTKFYSFGTLEELKDVPLDAFTKSMVSEIIESLWKDYSSEILYDRGDEEVLSPSILFVSPSDIKDNLDVRNPIDGFVDKFLHAYKDLTLVKGYGYVYTYHKYIDENIPTEYTQAFIEDEDEGLLNPPAYNSFTGEYKGD